MLERIEVEFFPPAVFPDGGREAFSEAAPLAVKRISKSTLTAHSRNVELVDSTLRQEERGTLKREARSELSGRKRSGGACWLWIALALAALGGVWWIFRRFL